MTRYVALGNGTVLVCLDRNYRIRDFYYPYVGQENHVSGKQHMTGVWTEEGFSWVSKDDWDLSIKYKEDTLVSDVLAVNHKLRVELRINETVHPDSNILIRKAELKNTSDKSRKLKLYFSQNFHIIYIAFY